MLEVFANSGFISRRSVDGGVVHVTFPTEETEQFLQASYTRERMAAAQSIRSFLNPHSAAVIGASREAGTIGDILLANLKRCGFTGPIYPVNPSAAEIEGLRTYPNVSAIGAPVDLAVVAVPAPAVEAVV